MNRNGGIVLWIVLGIFIVGAVVGYLVFGVFGNNPEARQILENPTLGLSDEEAVAQFDETFVIYMLYNIGANKLHRPPLSRDTPEIELLVGDETYSAEVVKGVISVDEGEISDEDILITTSAEEAVKMIRDSEYISDSFSEGKSEIELIAGKVELASKGYLGLYTELTGNEVEE
jgi:hypothetical protein